jgi:hypothetical protein
VVKSVTVPGKCYAISDSDRQDNPIGKCPMLKLVIERATKKSPHYSLAGNLFNAVHGIHKHQFVGFVLSYTKSNVVGGIC